MRLLRVFGRSEFADGENALIPPEPAVLRDDHLGVAAPAATTAFQAMPQLLDVQVAADLARQLARIDVAGVAAPSAEEPQPPFRPHGVAQIRDRPCVIA